MIVTVYPQFNFYETTPFNDSNVENHLNDYFICINSTGHIHSVPHFKQHHPNVLNCSFDDTDHDHTKFDTIFNVEFSAKVCTAEQAKEIVNFVDNIPLGSMVHIYCAKGKSRSTAVGKFVEEYHSLPVKTEYKTYNQFIYNLLCSI
jgi:predicted protein tyrosine phosphatase